MKTSIFVLTAISILCINSHGICANQQAGLPIGFVGGCEVDLNADGNLDSALLINTTKGYELIVIMRLGENTKNYVVNRSESKRFLTCQHGKQIKETDAGPGNKRGKTHHTNGAYLVLTEVESSEVAYFWSEGKFKEVWLSD